MKQMIRIMVEVLDRLKIGEFKLYFNHVMTVDDFLQFDYTRVLLGLHCLFSDGVITFKVM